MSFPDFPALLLEHGFPPETGEFESISLGFQHEIYNALIHHSPVFREQSRIREQLNVPGEMIRCDLFTYAGDLKTAVPFFYRQWFEELRYENPVREVLILDRAHHSAQIRALTISRCNAMTFCFYIQ